jgi:hypothetical protein
MLRASLTHYDNIIYIRHRLCACLVMSAMLSKASILVVEFETLATTTSLLTEKNVKASNKS